MAADRVRATADRRQRLAALAALSSSPVYDYEASIGLLVGQGLEERHVRGGSMPESSLEWVANRLHDACRQASVMVHVGNFLGVSLTYLTSALRRLDPAGLVISVDPAMPHRDIDRPDQYVHMLLRAYGLSANSIVISGYSGDANIRNDGFIPTGGVEPASTDAACEQVLRNLARLLPSRVDVVVLDGNHDAEYLRGELEQVATLLRPGGLLVLDDVSVHWQEIAAVFDRLMSGQAFEREESDGRVGIAYRTSQ
jgi:hypothetical protein